MIEPAYRRPLSAAAAVGVAVVLTFSIGPSSGATTGVSGAASIGATDWPAYEHGPAHSSTAVGDGAITAAKVPGLHALWTFHAGPATAKGEPGPAFDASPTVVNGVVYVGSRTGVFYALNAATGAIVWQRLLDYGSSTVCAARGIVGTADVAADPASGALTVYAPGAHYLYALDAASGAQRWKVSIGPATAAGEARYLNWASPTVIGGHVYVGLAANCEAHLVRGGLVELNQHTGHLLHTYYAVPTGKVGASVWSSVASDGTSVWVTTGNPDPAGTAVYDSFSIVRLSAATLTKVELWTVPAQVTQDLDFGSSPTLFQPVVNGVATKLVGACNKNGVFYAWQRDHLAGGPVWQLQVGQSGGTGNGACLTSAAYSGKTQQLFVAANQTTVANKAVPGSVRSVNPATGAVLWQQPLGCLPNGSPTLNVTTQLLTVPLYGQCTGTAKPGVELFDATTGTLLRTLVTTKPEFAQPVFAEGRLYVADESGTLTAYVP